MFSPMKSSAPIFPRHQFAAVRNDRRAANASPVLLESVTLDAASVYARFATRPDGLSAEEARERLDLHGLNVLAKDQQISLGELVWHAAANPLVVLLAVLAGISFVTNDISAGVMMTLMIVLGMGLKLIQEAKADHVAAKLKAMISVTATVIRNGQTLEIPVAELVPGDIVTLSAGDMIPADLRIVTAKDLFVTQSMLTGESFAVEKFEQEKVGVMERWKSEVLAEPQLLTDVHRQTRLAGNIDLPVPSSPLELVSVAFLGTSVESGSARGVVVVTGKETLLGGMAASLSNRPVETAFDKSIARFTWLMLQFLMVMAPMVFVINGVAKGDWVEAFFFAIAVAVGLTPEMLPMIVTVCLSKGALAMSRRKVIVKRLNSIQNLGAMDVLCTDKTGTLTMDRVILERYCDVVLQPDDGVLTLAYLNSHFQTGLRNVLDRAILAHTETHAEANVPDHVKVDEIPFDFQRRIMSVVVRTPEWVDRIISKGAPESIFSRCKNFELDGELHAMDDVLIADLKEEYEHLSSDGFRVLALASKDVSPRDDITGPGTPYSKTDECDLVLNGYVAFLDPPKETATPALRALQTHGIAVKVVTGDNELVSKKICKEVGLSTEFMLLGSQVESLTDEQLADVVTMTTLFARVSPAHKQRIIRALQSRGHTVGFMGDGINDAPALRAADVGISVDTAVDIAKESADMILLEKSLLVLEEGVVEGRKVFANILKYVRMGASSNFGNMFSVLGASIFVPYLPMLPIQILANNLLYDISQTAIPTDDVDLEQVERPRPWDMKQLTRFILCIGPCSSIFDYTTFFMMLSIFHCWNVSTPEAKADSERLFQTGWFVESLLTQTLIIHIIRTNRIPFLQSRASWPLLFTTICVMAAGIALPYTGLGQELNFTPLPMLYWPLLALSTVCYLGLTQFVKIWLLRKKWI